MRKQPTYTWRFTMLTDFILRCVLCDHCASHSVDTEKADAFIAENAGPGCTHVCNRDTSQCAEARSYGVGTMKIDRIFVLARECGTDLHTMTQEYFSWITDTSTEGAPPWATPLAPQAEWMKKNTDVPF
jgi:hypothetical protein